MARSSFYDIINRDKPTLVDFYATWCGPCQGMHPILKGLAKDLGAEAKILKIDIDKNQKLAKKLEVMSVPTFIIYKKGKIVWRRSGAMSKGQLKKKIEAHF